MLGRYRLLDEIAVGGTARVHRARDQQLGREVAVKLLHPHLLPDERSRRRLEAEARAAARLSHPGIAAVYDVDADAEAPALVMELVKGESLAARLARRGPLPAREAARIGAEVADALYLAHRNGIVHRDVKPGNILLERDGRVRLIDFGIAQSLAPGTQSLTQTGTTLGTPRYMSPEQMAGSPAGPRSDLWSLGVVLHQAVTGRVPFDGATPLAIARQQHTGPPALPANVDPALASLVAACLAHRVEDRPIHAGAVADSLRTWSGDGLDATTVTQLMPQPVSAVVGGSRPPVAMPSQSPALARSTSRPGRLPVPVGIGLAALAAVLVLAVALLAGPPREAADAPASAAPTRDWVTALAAAHLDACGEPVDTERLEEMSRDAAEAWVDELVTDCLEGDDDDGSGRGNNGNGNGNGGNGNNGNGNGGGPGRGNGGGNGRGG
ncbi:MAG TPA: serine/threonine-protein kinase [Candidatus Limnocylindria bacterium]